MSVFKCKMCGGALNVSAGMTVTECEYCGTKQTLPHLDDERRSNLYDRANHFRRNNDFDKAMGIYENILNEDSTDAEAYWSIVLCRYGIEYVEDPATRKRVPTVNRAQFTSIFDDEDYRSAISNADSCQREIYENEAAAINEIQKGIIAISQKEEPFDVFICYKETDSNGRRTRDSVLATELYHELTNEGYKVFFSRITLEDKLGTAYEPYIFAALNSSRVMVVLGTKPEYFSAVWVKNEWSRYLALIKNGANKTLIPAYRDIDPYELPEEFSHLQAQDMSKLGFMQDLIRGIEKIVGGNRQKKAVETFKPTAEPTVIGNTATLLERAGIFLEDGDWENADLYFEKVLDLEPKNALAYFGKLMVECRAKSKEELKNLKKPFDDSNNYQRVMRFASSSLKNELEGYIDFINTRNKNELLESIYRQAQNTLASARSEQDFTEAAQLFEKVGDYKEASAYAAECYEKAKNARKDRVLSNAQRKIMEKDTVTAYEEAMKMLEAIRGWKNADELAEVCKKRIEQLNIEAEEKRLRELEQAKRNKLLMAIITLSILAIILLSFIIANIVTSVKYNNATDLMDEGKYSEALVVFEELNDYKDSPKKVLQCRTNLYNEAVALAKEHEYMSAANIFGDLGDFSDAKDLYTACRQAFDGQYTSIVNLLKLTSFEIPSNITKINTSAFKNATTLTSVTIPDSVTSIGGSAFYGCSSLTSITIPNSVNKIEDYAFYSCYKLVEVVNNSSLNIEAYYSAYGHIGYYAIEVHNGTSKIVNKDGYLFYTCNTVNYLIGYAGSDTSLTLPTDYNGEKYEIDNYAFYNYTNLTNVTIPNGVTSIGKCAFYGCSSLTSITIPTSVTSFGGDVSQNCKNLKQINYTGTSAQWAKIYNYRTFSGIKINYNYNASN